MGPPYRDDHGLPVAPVRRRRPPLHSCRDAGVACSSLMRRRGGDTDCIVDADTRPPPRASRRARSGTRSVRRASPRATRPRSPSTCRPARSVYARNASAALAAGVGREARGLVRGAPGARPALSGSVPSSSASGRARAACGAAISSSSGYGDPTLARRRSRAPRPRLRGDGDPTRRRARPRRRHATSTRGGTLRAGSLATSASSRGRSPRSRSRALQLIGANGSATAAATALHGGARAARNRGERARRRARRAPGRRPADRLRPLGTALDRRRAPHERRLRQLRGGDAPQGARRDGARARVDRAGARVVRATLRRRGRSARRACASPTGPASRASTASPCGARRRSSAPERPIPHRRRVRVVARRGRQFGNARNATRARPTRGRVDREDRNDEPGLRPRRVRGRRYVFAILQNGSAGPVLDRARRRRTAS